MVEDVSELVVRVRPDGMDETQRGLGDVSDSFEETADDVGESTGLLSGFADKFKGAGIVFAAAFGTMIGAIASKMPIISETATALDALLTAVGLRMDRLTRGPLSEMNTKIFDLADAISEPGRELEALNLALDIAIEGLKKTPAAMPFVALAKLVDHFVNVEGAIQNFRDSIAGIGSFLATQLQNAKNTVINTFINPIIDGFNEAINLANRLPGVDIGNIGRVGTLPVEGITTRPGTGGPGGFTSSQIDQLRASRNTGVVQTSVNIDSRKVAETTKPFTVRGVLNTGRGRGF